MQERQGFGRKENTTLKRTADVLVLPLLPFPSSDFFRGSFFHQ